MTKNSFEKMYYISNTVWKRNLNIEKTPKFDIKYQNIIIFHFDFFYSLFKVSSFSQPSKHIFIDALNVCLRNYDVIKQLYPYNKCYIIIYTKNKKFGKLNIDYDTFKTIIDIIPNIAIITENNREELEYFNSENYKHIFYGNVYSRNMFNKSECQFWNILQGKLLIKV